MFERASKIRIPTTLIFYLLTFLLSLSLLSVLNVSTRNFYFGVATTILAHAAVYLLTRERIPAWATLFVLALVVPQLPPEALTPVEEGALYWGILAGLVSYTLTYGAHYFLNRNRDDSDKETKDSPRRKADRHTSELFQLLNVTSLSQAVRTTRRLLQEKDRQQSDTVSAMETAEASEADVLQKKLKETQQHVKDLRKKLEEAKQPRETERRQMIDRLEETERQMEETISAREHAEERAQSLESFQLKVAELTQQLNALRVQSQSDEQLVSDLRALVSDTESARDAALAENEHLQGELAHLNADSQAASSSLVEVTSTKENLVQELPQLRQQAQDMGTQNQELLAKLQGTEEDLAKTHCELQELKNELESFRSQSVTPPSQLDEVRDRVTSLEMEKDRAVAELGCLRSRLREKTREIERNQAHAADLDQKLQSQQQEIAAAQKQVASLEDSLAFYRRTVEELTPEVDRLDAVISEYEHTFGPLRSKQNN